MRKGPGRCAGDPLALLPRRPNLDERGPGRRVERRVELLRQTNDTEEPLAIAIKFTFTVGASHAVQPLRENGFYEVASCHLQHLLLYYRLRETAIIRRRIIDRSLSQTHFSFHTQVTAIKLRRDFHNMHYQDSPQLDVNGLFLGGQGQVSGSVLEGS